MDVELKFSVVLMTQLFLVLYLYTMVNCVIFRTKLFVQREVAWWKAIIPGYNKYILGSLSDSKLLGFVCGLSRVCLNLVILAYLITATKQLPASVLSILFIVFTVTSFVSWTIMMKNFSVKNNKSSWLMFIWAIFPLAMYIYFTQVSKYRYINGTTYKIKELKEVIR